MNIKKRDNFGKLAAQDVREMPPAQQPMPRRQVPTSPQRPVPSPYYGYQPGTVYNPIGVPPGAYEIPGAYAPGRNDTPLEIREPGGIGQPRMIIPERPSPVDFEQQPGPPTLTDPAYIQGYLRTVIGEYIKAEFVVGTNMFIDREGTLVEVGVDHFVIQEPETDDLLLCDMYSVKFVKVFY